MKFVYHFSTSFHILIENRHISDSMLLVGDAIASICADAISKLALLLRFKVWLKIIVDIQLSNEIVWFYHGHGIMPIWTQNKPYTIE